ncbi:hypothetical protein ACWEO2_33240 [Nocardia sp. NPDC004278]
MSRLLTKTLATVTLTAALSGVAATPAIADTPTPGTGSSLIQTGSAGLQSGSAAVINPLYALLCALATASSICHIGPL